MEKILEYDLGDSIPIKRLQKNLKGMFNRKREKYKFNNLDINDIADKLFGFTLDPEYELINSIQREYNIQFNLLTNKLSLTIIKLKDHDGKEGVSDVIDNAKNDLAYCNNIVKRGNLTEDELINIRDKVYRYDDIHHAYQYDNEFIEKTVGETSTTSIDTKLKLIRMYLENYEVDNSKLFKDRKNEYDILLMDNEDEQLNTLKQQHLDEYIQLLKQYNQELLTGKLKRYMDTERFEKFLIERLLGPGPFEEEDLEKLTALINIYIHIDYGIFTTTDLFKDNVQKMYNMYTYKIYALDTLFYWNSIRIDEEINIGTYDSSIDSRILTWLIINSFRRSLDVDNNILQNYVNYNIQTKNNHSHEKLIGIDLEFAQILNTRQLQNCLNYVKWDYNTLDTFIQLLYYSTFKYQKRELVYVINKSEITNPLVSINYNLKVTDSEQEILNLCPRDITQKQKQSFIRCLINNNIDITMKGNVTNNLFLTRCPTDFLFDYEYNTQELQSIYFYSLVFDRHINIKYREPIEGVRSDKYKKMIEEHKVTLGNNVATEYVSDSMSTSSCISIQNMLITLWNPKYKHLQSEIEKVIHNKEENVFNPTFIFKKDGDPIDSIITLDNETFYDAMSLHRETLKSTLKTLSRNLTNYCLKHNKRQSSLHVYRGLSLPKDVDISELQFTKGFVSTSYLIDVALGFMLNTHSPEDEIQYILLDIVIPPLTGNKKTDINIFTTDVFSCYTEDEVVITDRLKLIFTSEMSIPHMSGRDYTMIQCIATKY